MALDAIDWMQTYNEPPAIYRALREACAPAPGCQGVDATYYGADPSGSKDSAAAINAAIAAAAGRPVLLPAGKYRLEAPIRFTPSGTGHVPGLSLLGAGQQLTVLQVRHSQGPAIVMDQTPDRAYQFGQYGMLAGFTLDGLGTANGPALQFTGGWRYQMEDMTIRYFNGNGVSSPWRSDIYSNPDAWQTSLRMTRVTIDGNKGWGIYSDAATGFLLNADDLLVRQNTAGGVNLTGGVRLVGGGIAYNGGPGLVLRKSPLGAIPQLSVVERVEFDGNSGPHLQLNAAARISVRSSRFISQPINGVFKPLTAVMIGNASPTSEGAVTGAVFDQCGFRATVGYAWTGFSFGSKASYANVAIDYPLWITFDATLQRKLGPEVGAGLVNLRE